MEKVTTKRLALYTGRTHPELAKEVATHLNIELGTDNLSSSRTARSDAASVSPFAVPTCS